MAEHARHRYERWGLREVLREYPGLSLRPKGKGGAVLTGALEFSADYKRHEAITDAYEVEIHIDAAFPRRIPTATETGNRIRGGFHTNDDGTLCLGSPLRLQAAFRRRPTLLGFVENCLIPYLYGYSFLERHDHLPWGDLAHGYAGLIDEYKALLHVDDIEACLEMILLLGTKKRIANKRPCPCGSGLRVGRCHHRALNSLRKVASRSWFRGEHKRLGGSVRTTSRRNRER